MEPIFAIGTLDHWSAVILLFANTICFGVNVHPFLLLVSLFMRRHQDTRAVPLLLVMEGNFLWNSTHKNRSTCCNWSCCVRATPHTYTTFLSIGHTFFTTPPYFTYQWRFNLMRHWALKCSSRFKTHSFPTANHSGKSTVSQFAKFTVYTDSCANPQNWGSWQLSTTFCGRKAVSIPPSVRTHTLSCLLLPARSHMHTTHPHAERARYSWTVIDPNCKKTG